MKRSGETTMLWQNEIFLDTQEDITLFPLEDTRVCFLQQLQDLWPVHWRPFFVYFYYIPETFVQKSREDSTSTPKLWGGLPHGGMCQRDVTHSWLVLSKDLVIQVLNSSRRIILPHRLVLAEIWVTIASCVSILKWRRCGLCVSRLGIKARAARN